MLRHLTFILIILLLNLCHAHAQNEQASPASLLKKKLEQGNPYREQLYAHLNKTVFVNNERIWFKVYSIGQAGNHPFSQPHNIYVSLYNESGNAVDSQVLLSQNGSVAGSINIPDGLPSGTYLFRAYSNWMKNFGDSLGFCQAIRLIHDTLAPGQIAFLERKPAEPYQVQLAAEGGYLLTGISSSMGLSIADSLGRPIAVKGWIRDGRQQIVDSIQTDTSGFARFDFSPRAGESYSAIVSLPGHHLKSIAFPEIRKEGVSLRLQRPAPGQVQVMLRTNESALAGMRGQPFYLMLQNEGIASPAGTIRLMETENSLDLPADRIKTGINHLWVFDSALNQVAHRAFFVTAPPVQLIRDVRAKRISKDTVECSFALEQLNNGESADMSVSILPAGSLGREGRFNVQAGLQRPGAIAGILGTPVPRYPEAVPDAEMLLLKDSDLSDKKKQYLPAVVRPLENGFLIKGKIENFITAKAVKNNEVILFSPNNNLLLTANSMDGTFQFSDLYLKDSSIVLISAQNAKNGRSGLRTLALEPPRPAYDHFKPYIIVQPETPVASDSPEQFRIKGNLLHEVTIKDKRNAEIAVMRENQSQLYQNNIYTMFRETIGICLSIDLRERKTYVCAGCTPPCRPRRPCNIYVDDKELELTMDFPPYFQWPPMYLIDTVIWDKKHAKVIIKTKPERKGGFEQIKVAGFAAYIPFTPALYTFQTEAEPFEKLAALYWNPGLRGARQQQYTFRYYAPPEIKETRFQLEGLTTEGRLLHSDLPVPVASP